MKIQYNTTRNESLLNLPKKVFHAWMLPLFIIAFLQTPSKAQVADTTKLTVFEEQLSDPYMKRYGRAPGEGWIGLPKTNSSIRFSGFIQLAVLHDFQNAGFPYEWFVPALIPVPTEDQPGTQFDFRASRVVFESSTNLKRFGLVKSYVEVDFYGNLANPLRDSDPNLRLRQAYVTFVGPDSKIAFTLGQAWSTFVDLETWPMILDMQGPNAMTGARQGMLRGSYAFKKNLVFDLALEQPNTLVQNGNKLSSLPDLAARLNYRGDWGHVQGAGIARQLMAESTEGTGRATAFGYGLLLSGSLNVPGTLRKNSPVDNLGARQDKIQFQLQGGSGLGRYVNDLTTTITPQDAIYQDADQSLHTIPELGWFVCYLHWWNDNLRTQLVYSSVNVDNLSIEEDTALHHTTFALANLSFTLFKRMDIAVEYLYGQRENKDGQTGHANRVQIGFNYGF